MAEVVLVAGGSGAMAFYLNEYLKTRNVKVWSIGRRPRAPWLDWYEPLDLMTAGIDYLVNRIRDVAPTRVFNLAGYANVRQSFDRPDEIITNNMTATVKLYEALRRAQSIARIVHISTSEVYGAVGRSENPIRESQPSAPISPYAVSKAAQESAVHYFQTIGLHIVTTRAFGYINPRRPDLVATAIARQVVEAEEIYEKGKVVAGGTLVIKYGNPHPQRTFCDVRDMARAYWLASVMPPRTVYNIGETNPITIGALAQLIVDRGRAPVELVHDPQLYRPADIEVCVPNCAAFERDTGWKPRIALTDSIDWLLESIREENRKGGGNYGEQESRKL